MQDWENNFCYFNYLVLNGLTNPYQGGARLNEGGSRQPLPRTYKRVNGAPLRMFFPLNKEKYGDDVVDISLIMLNNFQEYFNNAVNKLHHKPFCKDNLCKQTDERVEKNIKDWEKYDRQQFDKTQQSSSKKRKGNEGVAFLMRSPSMKAQDDRAEATLDTLKDDIGLLAEKVGKMTKRLKRVCDNLGIVMEDVESNRKLLFMVMRGITGGDKEEIKQDFKNFMAREGREEPASSTQGSAQ